MTLHATHGVEGLFSFGNSIDLLLSEENRGNKKEKGESFHHLFRNGQREARRDKKMELFTEVSLTERPG